MKPNQRKRAMDALHRAVGRMGSQTAVAHLLKLKPQTISKRLKDQIPLQSAKEVLAVEAATGVSRHDLRPDLYPREDGPAQPPAAADSPVAGGPASPLAGLRA